MKNSSLTFLGLILASLAFASDSRAQTAVAGFDANLSGLPPSVCAIAVQPNGQILIGGSFTSVQRESRIGMARLNPDGSLDRRFNPQSHGPVCAIAVQSDGRVLAAGSFTTITGVQRDKIARLDKMTGIVEGSFNPNPNNGSVHDFSTIDSIAVQADDKILIAGYFTRIGTENRKHIARLMPDGTLDATFNPNPDSTVSTITVQSDRRILVGGAFTHIGGANRKRIARLNPTNGLVDPADRFDADIRNGFVTAIAVQSDGRVLAGGSFSRIGKLRYRNLARLDAETGSPDTMFDPNRKTYSIGSVDSIALQSDGRVIVGCNALGPRTLRTIARLAATTGLPDSFDPAAVGSIYSIALRPDGEVLVGGNFNRIGGRAIDGFALLSNDTDAVSTIEVTSASVILRRNGSAPQLTRAVVEHSIDDGASYNFLGDTVTTASEYSLTGIRLPTERTMLVRVRGYFRSGYRNGSETTIEQVQLACLLPATSTNLIRNHSFELTPCTTPCNQDQDRLPLDWLRLAGSSDTFSNDGSYGWPPDAMGLGNFTGALAQEGIRWVAAGSHFGPEIFGQDLTCPLIPGQEYRLTAYLLQAVRTDLAHAGTYKIELWDSDLPSAHIIEVGRLMPYVTSSTEWQLSTLAFTAPPEAASYRVLAFRAVGLADESAYPGIDDVVLLPVPR